VKRCSVEKSVNEAGGYEEPGGAMEGTPALVPTEHPTNVAYERRIARGPHQVPKRR